MQEKDRKQFSLLMRKLRVTFPANLNDKDEIIRGEVYWEEFKNVSIDIFEKIIMKSISECNFFPKPAELNNFINIIRDQEFYNHKNKEFDESIKALEYNPIDNKEKAIECLNKIKEILKEREIKPTLEDGKAKEFERKRLEAKEKLKQLS